MSAKYVTTHSSVGGVTTTNRASNTGTTLSSKFRNAIHFLVIYVSKLTYFLHNAHSCCVVTASNIKTTAQSLSTLCNLFLPVQLAVAIIYMAVPFIAVTRVFAQVFSDHVDNNAYNCVITPNELYGHYRNPSSVNVEEKIFYFGSMELNRPVIFGTAYLNHMT